MMTRNEAADDFIENFEWKKGTQELDWFSLEDHLNETVRSSHDWAKLNREDEMLLVEIPEKFDR